MSWLERRMVVISNRLPLTIEESKEGFRLDGSSGGLVTAFRPLLNDCAGVWMGWTGTDCSPANRSAPRRVLAVKIQSRTQKLVGG
jgi:trehalose-6-phosphate synthase